MDAFSRYWPLEIREKAGSGTLAIFLLYSLLQCTLQISHITRMYLLRKYLKYK